MGVPDGALKLCPAPVSLHRCHFTRLSFLCASSLCLYKYRGPFKVRFTSQSSILFVTMCSVGNLSCIVTVVRSLGFGCGRRTLSVLVLSTCPLYPRGETVLLLLRIPGWR